MQRKACYQKLQGYVCLPLDFMRLSLGQLQRGQ